MTFTTLAKRRNSLASGMNESEQSQPSANPGSVLRSNTSMESCSVVNAPEISSGIISSMTLKLLRAPYGLFASGHP
ncbi:hypothetical protein D3C78_1414960 [compost metagenome]